MLYVTDLFQLSLSGIKGVVSAYKMSQ